MDKPNSMTGELKSKALIKQFMYAGKSIFTIKNTETGNRFTFKIQADKKKLPIHYVSFLWGSDNESNYQFFGTIFDQKSYYFSKNHAKIKADATVALAFKWFFELLNSNSEFPTNIQIWHEGKCCRCGRKLTVPESIADGIGSECAKKVRRVTIL